MTKPLKTLIVIALTAVVLTPTYFYLDSIINENSRHNSSIVSFGGMKKHDQLSLTELESNFNSRNDFRIISHYGRDMDFNSDYLEGDSLITYYNYKLKAKPDTFLAIVLTYKDFAKTLCINCSEAEKEKFNHIYDQATNRNIKKLVNALDSIGLWDK
jgi:hypothetical protein